MLALNTPHKSFFRLLNKWFLVPLILSSNLYCNTWAEDTLKNLSLKDKIAQLMMVPVWTSGEKSNIDDVVELLDKYPIGSILFMQGNIDSQQKAAKTLQERSQVPLFFGQDAEWGLDLRLKGSLRFPRNLTLGAIQNNQLIYDLGIEIANQCKGVSVHVNFAPVADVNNNPDNPVINDRSFGEDPQKVSQKTQLIMQGMQDGGIIACAKHFPGHGDTSCDSHHTLPVIHKSVSDLEEVEWKPFNNLIKNGIQSIMTGHLLLPKVSNLPSSLCPTNVNHFLKHQLGFQGLVFTDALNMKAISDNFSQGQSELLALQAGSDVLMWPLDINKSIDTIYEAVSSKEVSIDDIDYHALKILETKEKLNLHLNTSIGDVKLFSENAIELKKKLFKEAITLINNSDHCISINPSKKCAFIQVGRDVAMKDALELVDSPYEEQHPDSLPPLFNHLSNNLQLDYFFVPKQCDEEFISKLVNQLNSYQQIIISVYEMNKYSRRNFGITASTLDLLEQLQSKSPYLCLFGSPYSLKNFENQNIILMGYENDIDAQIGCAEILLNQREAKGRLPISSGSFKAGFGLQTSY
ncbi:MAG: Beta-hexosaminidase [Chlamydiae bacterium]|nr:Beta-hexosaminidase [Chlamydiota bacterium]